jgi:nitroimidazol reductase NimA-like FMN-containing flavoprotein (pyridoxamine 5'-phosphate oxidase superfamily)
MLRELETGIPICVTVTLVDGLVSSGSAFDHSMNYRSVVAFGRARQIIECVTLPDHVRRYDARIKWT